MKKKKDFLDILISILGTSAWIITLIFSILKLLNVFPFDWFPWVFSPILILIGGLFFTRIALWIIQEIILLFDSLISFDNDDEDKDE